MLHVKAKHFDNLGSIINLMRALINLWLLDCHKATPKRIKDHYQLLLLNSL